MVAVLYALLSVLFDVKFYKIPNILCFFIAMNGILFSFIKAGFSEMDCLVLGILIPVLALYILFYCGAIGAGDVKELAALGTFFGKDIWKVLILSFVFNGFIAVVKMKKNASFFTRFYYMKGYLRDCRLDKRILDNYESGKEDRIHFSIGILCAVICMTVMKH
ncbi:MAG: A24 family peptidase [Lachnospiraceae bacterium]|nr:A24 family peptidase [Lachnospiraceae bacterium]